MSIGDCCNPCPPFTPPVNIPGSPGEAGIPGSNGVNSFSTIASFQGVGFVVPAVGSSATIYLTDTGEWMSVNQPVYISGAGQYQVTAPATVGANGTSVQLKNLGTSGNAVPGSTISAGNTISPSGVQGTNAFTTTTATFTVPNVNATATITCANVAWMIPGETVFVQGGGYLVVISVNTTNGTAVLENIGNADTTAGAVIPTGFGVGPSGTQGSLPLPQPVVSTQVGLSTNLTTSMAAISGATVTLPSAGTWLIMCRMSYLCGSTSSPGTTGQSFQVQLNAQAGGSGPFTQIPNSKAISQSCPVTSGNVGGNVITPYVIYTTTTIGDVIQVYADYSVTAGTTAGTNLATEVSLVATCVNLTT
jgi:hypothetical protein